MYLIMAANASKGQPDLKVVLTLAYPDTMRAFRLELTEL